MLILYSFVVTRKWPAIFFKLLVIINSFAVKVSKQVGNEIRMFQYPRVMIPW